MSSTNFLDSEFIDGKFKLESELGAGAFGSVYKATQYVLDRPMRQVALKLFKSDVINEDNVREQMNDALAILDLLSVEPDWEIRQHFVSVFDLGVTGEKKPRGFVSMELVRGGNLQKRISNLKTFTLSGTLHYLKQLLTAMAFMHRNQYVHSDLKPENILVFAGRGQDLIKIGDFGLSGKLNGIIGEGGPRGGTMAYLAIEALQGSNTTPACDVFSMGLIAYEMLMGENPYAKVGQHATKSQRDDISYLNDLHRKARLEKPIRLLPGQFPELCGSTPDPRFRGMVKIINKMLEVYPDQRYRSLDDALQDLNSLRGSVGSQDSKVQTTTAITKESGHSELSSVKKECEEHIAACRWTNAIEIANQLIDQAPTNPAGYLLKSQIKREQAKQYKNENKAEALVLSTRKQALTPLRSALKKCPHGPYHRQINQELANIYRLLGKHDEAQKYLTMGGSR